MLTEGQSYGFPSVAVNITPKTNRFSAFLPVKKPAGARRYALGRQEEYRKETMTSTDFISKIKHVNFKKKSRNWNRRQRILICLVESHIFPATTR